MLGKDVAGSNFEDWVLWAVGKAEKIIDRELAKYKGTIVYVKIPGFGWEEYSEAVKKEALSRLIGKYREGNWTVEHCFYRDEMLGSLSFK